MDGSSISALLRASGHAGKDREPRSARPGCLSHGFLWKNCRKRAGSTGELCFSAHYGRGGCETSLTGGNLTGFGALRDARLLAVPGFLGRCFGCGRVCPRSHCPNISFHGVAAAGGASLPPERGSYTSMRNLGISAPCGVGVAQQLGQPCSCAPGAGPARLDMAFGVVALGHDMTCQLWGGGFGMVALGCASFGTFQLWNMTALGWWLWDMTALGFWLLAWCLWDIPALRWWLWDTPALRWWLWDIPALGWWLRGGAFGIPFLRSFLAPPLPAVHTAHTGLGPTPSPVPGKGEELENCAGCAPIQPEGFRNLVFQP